MTMEVVFTDLYQAILLCRPRNVIAFASRFLQDNKLSWAEEAHALHVLPFLLHKPDHFQAYACTVYCASLSGKSFLLNNPQDTANKAPEQTIAREYLDGNAVLEIIQGFDLATTMGFQISSIDEMVSEKIEALKQVDFKLFLTLLRLLLSLYGLNIWVRDEITDLLLFFSPLTISALPLPAEQPVETAKLRAFIQKRPKELGCGRCSVGYHLNASREGPELHASLSKILLAVIEDERGQTVALEALADKFLRKYVQVHSAPY